VDERVNTNEQMVAENTIQDSVYLREHIKQFLVKCKIQSL